MLAEGFNPFFCINDLLNKGQRRSDRSHNAAVFSLVVGVVELQSKSLIEFVYGFAFKAGKHLAAHGQKETFDLSFSLRFIRFCMHQVDA